MAETSTIEWTDATWNPITGCSVVSPGCTNCYAMGLAGTRLKNHPSRMGLTQDSKAGPVWNGKVRFNEEWLDQPLRWKRPRMIFVCAHGDLFHENVLDEWIDRVFAIMALAPHHTFQVLTKRAKRMREYVGSRAGGAHFAQYMRPYMAAPRSLLTWPVQNVWLGVSAEDQRRADERIPDLLATPAAVRFGSAEPLLGALDLTSPLYHDAVGITMRGFLRNKAEPDDYHFHSPKLDWIIVGGESGTGARAMHPDWARSIRDQCAAAGVPFFFKQWGEYYPEDQPVACGGEDHDPDRCDTSTGELMFRVGKKAAGRLLDGVTHDGMPERA